MAIMQNIYMGLCVLSIMVLVLGLLNIFGVIDILGDYKISGSLIIIIISCISAGGFYGLYRYRPYERRPFEYHPTSSLDVPDELSRLSQNSE